MADSIQISAAARSLTLTGIGPARRAQEVQQAVQARLLASVEEAGRIQAVAHGADRVEISREAQRLLAAEAQPQG